MLEGHACVFLKQNPEFVEKFDQVQNLSESAFIPLNGALVLPHPEYSMPAYSPILMADVNPREQIQRKAGNWHSSSSLGRATAAAKSFS